MVCHRGQARCEPQFSVFLPGLGMRSCKESGVVLLAVFIGMIIFIIFALDRPFRGDLGLQPGPYQLIYDQLMKP